MTARPDHRFPEDEIHTIAAVESSHWWYRGTREICFDLMEPFLPSRRPLRVLDVGCGTGGNLLRLAALGEVRGLDPSPLCVEYCRRKGLACAQGSMSDLSAVPGPFDLVTMFDVLSQAPAAETIAILSGIQRVLAPGGVLVFREPAMAIARGAHDRAVGIQHRFTRRSIREALLRAGLEPLRITYLNTLLFPPIVAVRRIGDLVSRGERVKSDVRPTEGVVNTLLLSVLRVETRILRLVDLPFGISVFAAARKRP